MNLRAPLIAGIIISLAVTAVWAWLSALTIGPSGPLDVTWRHPAASYLTLAAAPTGNGLELFAVVAFIFAVCIFVAGWRHARRPDLRRER
jgi:predicted ABC-type sugar transport system permease subunit